MKRRPVASIAPALVALALTYPAAAKGPVAAWLDGPGIDEPIAVTWEHQSTPDDPRRAPFQHVALATGRLTIAFADASQATFDKASNALRLERPAGELGPKYTLTYRFEASGRADEIVQTIYPYAAPGPVTYLAPGSWFVAPPALVEALVEAGLPAEPIGPAQDRTWTFAVMLTALAVVVFAASLRRRPRLAT